MKKVFALTLAAVLAFSCMTVAFAAVGDYVCPHCTAPFASATEVNNHILLIHTTEAPKDAVAYPCPYCAEANQPKTFVTETAYHDHLQTCPNYKGKDTGLPINTFDMSISDLLAYIIEVANVDNDRLSILEPIIQSIITFVENFLKGLIDADKGVEGVTSDLNAFESKLASFNIDIGSGKIRDLLDSLKAKIKALYCGEPATTAVEEAPETGSASTGIAVFAAISVAAAAAYVCTKKRA